MIPPRRIPLALLALLLFAAPAAADPVSISQSTVYYDVSGTTPAQIAASIRQNMPPQTAGFSGLTAYYFTWNYDYHADYDALSMPDCEVSNARVAITITTYLPRHATIRSAAPNVIDLWKDYSVALRRHEAHHATDFIAVGAQIPDSIAAAHTPDCSTIADAVNAIGQHYVDRAQAIGDEFDAATNHGTADGASFPGL